MGVDGRCKAFTETVVASPRTGVKKEGIDAAVYVTSRDMERARALAVTLHRLHPELDVYVRVRTLAAQKRVSCHGAQLTPSASCAEPIAASDRPR